MSDSLITHSRFRLRRYFLIVTITISIVTAMGYSFYSSSQMINNFSPLVDATMEIKLEATTAHLWFEEIISGDQYESLDDIVKNIDKALWYAKAMIEGGQNEEGTFIPLDDERLKEEVVATIEQLKEFKIITLTRYKAKENSGIGSEIDQQYDQLFKSFINQIDHVGTLLQAKIKQDFEQYKIIQLVLIIATILLSLIGFLIQFRYDHILAQNILKINKAKQTAEKNEQWLNTIMNSMGDGVITTDINGNLARINPVAEALVGWSQSDAQGRPLKTIFPIIDATTGEPIPNPVDIVMSTGKTVYLSNHTTLISRDGTKYQIADSAAPICDSDNIVLGMVLVFNDVTEKYRIREKLNQSLQRLSLHWQDSPMGMIEWNTDFEFIDLNPAAEQMFGFRKSEIQGKHITKNILSENAREAVDKVWVDLLANTGGGRIRNKNITKDGRTILCEWYNTPLINEEGKVIGVSSLIMDITEQERLKEQEQDNKDQLQQVLNSMLTMVATLSPNGAICFINTPALLILGLTENDVSSSKLWNGPWFSYNKTIQSMIENDCKRAASGETINRELEIATLDGLLWIDFSVHSVFDKNGKVILLVAEGRDASRRKLAEEHAIRSQKMEALSKIVGGIAHDYNNMLGVITGYTGLLKRKCEHVDGTEKFISEIVHATERGKKLTKKMLNFSRPESSHAESCNMNLVLQRFHDILAKSLTAVIKLEFDLNNEGWLVWLDVGELEDAILNMAINAKYAMPEGGMLRISTFNVHLAEKEAKYLNLSTNDYIRLTIADTGTGIDASVKEKIFDPFFSTKGDAGNGLGLSQVFGFMERTGGAINVYSQRGEGTQFSLYFPRYKQLANSTKITNMASVEPELSGNETILVVDDEPALRELARQILLDAGYKVLTAGDGKEALDMIPTQSIDLILSDVIMPNMDGYQMAQKVLEYYPTIKIQLTSGFSGDRGSILSDSTLKDNMLYKPYDSHELLLHVRLLLDGYILPKGRL